jgi:hypothetical protein
LGEWAVEYEMKINPGKSKRIRFTRARVKSPLGCTFGNPEIPEASSDLNWVDQVNYTAQKSLEGTSHCNARSQKRLAYTSLCLHDGIQAEKG